ncbi:hypothetical protein C900_00495 [Fulvivirga imtechensis AK7]|uniref:Uncharacterized protein n=1 Tax=Fulvivirga imtechensis AK7 TaxID=1237149 RepID=L8JXU3_9BACT|nr:hypothetical protein C900_00495 [Fulvivirga imtechensis AK7]
MLRVLFFGRKLIKHVTSNGFSVSVSSDPVSLSCPNVSL